MGRFLVILLFENKGPRHHCPRGKGKEQREELQITQNLLLGWAAGLQLGRELCRSLWGMPARW